MSANFYYFTEKVEKCDSCQRLERKMSEFTPELHMCLQGIKKELTLLVTKEAENCM